MTIQLVLPDADEALEALSDTRRPTPLLCWSPAETIYLHAEIVPRVSEVKAISNRVEMLSIYRRYFCQSLLTMVNALHPSPELID